MQPDVQNQATAAGGRRPMKSPTRAATTRELYLKACTPRHLIEKGNLRKRARGNGRRSVGRRSGWPQAVTPSPTNYDGLEVVLAQSRSSPNRVSGKASATRRTSRRGSFTRMVLGMMHRRHRDGDLAHPQAVTSAAGQGLALHGHGAVGPR